MGKTSIITRFMYDNFDNTYQVRRQAENVASANDSTRGTFNSLCISCLASESTSGKASAHRESAQIVCMSCSSCRCLLTFC